jgi:WD40 repeat protein
MSLRCVRWTLLFPVVMLILPVSADAESPRTDLYGDPLPKGAISRMGTVRLRHDLPLAFLAVSPDGKVLASASLGGTLRGHGTSGRSVVLWDLMTGKELMRLGHRDVGGHMAFSPDGKLLASAGCEDATVRVWKVQTGEELHVLVKHHQVSSDGKSDGYAAGVAFSPDGKLLATSGGDQVIRLWDIATGDEIDHWKIQAYADALAFSADGKRLAGTSGVWDVATGKQAFAFSAPPGGYPTTVLVSGDGKTVVVGNSQAVNWVDMATGKASRQMPGHLMAPPPNGSEFAVRDAKGVHIYDMADGKELWQFPISAGVLTTGALTADGKTLLTVEWQHVRIRAWETRGGKELFPERGHSAEVTFVGFSADGKELITTGDEAVRFWDVRIGKELRQLRGHAGLICQGAMSTDSKTLATVATDRTIRIWDLLAHGEALQLATDESPCFLLTLSADGKRLACPQLKGGGLGDFVRLMDATTGKELRRLTASDTFSTNSAAFSPDGKALVRRCGAELEQWDTVLGKRIGTYESKQPRAAPPASDVSFSSDGRLLASGYSEGKRAPWTVGLWEVASRRLISQLRGHRQPVVVAVFSADGKLLASGSWDKTVRLWDVASGRELACFEGHRGTVASLAFSPDAGRLASGSTDGTAIV